MVKQREKDEILAKKGKFLGIKSKVN